MRINVLTFGILLAADVLAQGEGMQPEGLTVQSLVNALLDPRPVVRSLAAGKLAQDKEKDTVPAIVEAFSQEGEERGFETLRGICSASASPPYLDLAAAQSALPLHDESCVDSLLGLIRSEQASPPWTPARDNIVHVGLSGLGGLASTAARSRISLVAPECTIS